MFQMSPSFFGAAWCWSSVLGMSSPPLQVLRCHWQMMFLDLVAPQVATDLMDVATVTDSHLSPAILMVSSSGRETAKPTGEKHSSQLGIGRVLPKTAEACQTSHSCHAGWRKKGFQKAGTELGDGTLRPFYPPFRPVNMIIQRRSSYFFLVFFTSQLSQLMFFLNMKLYMSTARL